MTPENMLVVEIVFLIAMVAFLSAKLYQMVGIIGRQRNVIDGLMARILNDGVEKFRLDDDRRNEDEDQDTVH